MGLRTMDYRAAIIGATVSLQPSQPQGTTVVCAFPADSPASA
ncbi:MAG TPA: hypothetical protein VD994_07225 [Prosthecobacter sp.]|nr:hypothetical protein [Prosthecobacter sp.]